MAIDFDIIKKLREQTGVGMAECKKVLDDVRGDINKAIEILRKKGLLKAAKKTAERTTLEGLIDSYIHANGKLGALIEVGCETDFVARTKEFKELVHNLALQVVGANPLFIKPEDISCDFLKKEKEIYRQQLAKEKKPKEVLEKIIQGKLQKYYEDVCLLEQPFIKDDKIKIKDLIAQVSAKVGEKIEVKRFVRFEI